MSLDVLTPAQWIAFATFVLLLLMCIGWMVRFRHFALYAVPPMMLALHGILFYIAYVMVIPAVSDSVLMHWSPFLRVQSSLTFILMMILMWEKLAHREKAEAEIDVQWVDPMTRRANVIRMVDEAVDLRINGVIHD